MEVMAQQCPAMAAAAPVGWSVSIRRPPDPVGYGLHPPSIPHATPRDPSVVLGRFSGRLATQGDCVALPALQALALLARPQRDAVPQLGSGGGEVVAVSGVVQDEQGHCGHPAPRPRLTITSTAGPITVGSLR